MIPANSDPSPIIFFYVDHKMLHLANGLLHAIHVDGSVVFMLPYADLTRRPVESEDQSDTKKGVPKRIFVEFAWPI